MKHAWRSRMRAYGRRSMALPRFGPSGGRGHPCADENGYAKTPMIVPAVRIAFRALAVQFNNLTLSVVILAQRWAKGEAS